MTIAAVGQPMPVACTETGLPWYSPVYPSSPRSAFFCTGLSK